MKRFSLMVPFFIIASCVLNSEEAHKPITIAGYYRDIDITHLKGVEKLTSISYPCIEIQNQGLKRKIIYHSTKDKKTEYEYIRKDSIWSSYYEDRRDTTAVYTYEIITPTRVIIFNYSSKESHRLIDVDIIDGYLETIIYPEKGFSVEPLVENIELIKKHMTSIYRNEFKINGSDLVQKSRKSTIKGETVFSSIECYKVQKRSMTWLLQFSNFLEEVKCK
jgi:hypothetical protein